MQYHCPMRWPNKHQLYYVKSPRAISVVSIFIMIMLNIALAGSLHASTVDQVMGGFTNTGKAVGYQIGSDGAPKNEFSKAIAIYVTGIAVMLAAFFVILVIYGGWLWMTAQGNDEKVAMGKKRILNGIIGLAIVIFGRLIAELVIYYLGQTLPSQS